MSLLDAPDLLEADFMETYGVSPYGMSVRQLATLAGSLPGKCRSHAHIDARAQNDMSDVLLSSICNWLSIIDYHYTSANTQRGKRAPGKPVLITLPGFERERETDVATMTREEFDRRRREAQIGS